MACRAASRDGWGIASRPLGAYFCQLSYALAWGTTPRCLSSMTSARDINSLIAKHRNQIEAL